MNVHIEAGRSRQSETSVETVPFVRLDGSSLPPREQLATWGSFMRGHQVSAFGDPERFYVESTCWQLGPMLINPTRLGPVAISRTERASRLDHFDHYNFFMLVEGSWEGRVGSRTVSAQPGDIHVIDFSQPLETRSPGSFTISVQLPRALVDELVLPFDMHGLLLKGPAAQLLGDYILSLVRRLPEMPQAHAPALVRATRDLIAAVLSTANRRGAPATVPALASKAKRFIQKNLDKDLSPDAVAIAMGTSRSTLYRAFEVLGGIEAYVREMRLTKAHEILAQPDERRSVAEIAFALGYASNSHFSRAFRKHYGYTPGEARAMTARYLRGQPPSEDEDDLQRYQAWKNGLR